MTQEARFQALEQYGFGPNVMKRSKVCARCGKMVGSSVKVCPACGEALPKETLFDAYKQRHRCCNQCETVLPPDANYCPNCGNSVH